MSQAGTGGVDRESGRDRERETDERRASFGRPDGARVSAADYDAVRPEWPGSTLGWLIGKVSTTAAVRAGTGTPADAGAESGLVVVDVGAGTGKGSRALARMGHRVLAVEPSGGMRTVLAGSLESLPPSLAARVEVLDASAERLPVADGTVDAVVALQAWHWFDQEAAAAEAARVLRPGGFLGLAWHQRDESRPWAAEVSRVVQRSAHMGDSEEDDAYRPDLPPQFGPSETVLLRWSMKQSVDDFVRSAATWSFVAVSADREAMLSQVRRIAARAVGAGGRLEVPMTTRCYRARRR